MWFETHTHLSDSQFDTDRDAVIQSAISAGVERIVEIADGPEEWDKARILAERYPDHFFWAAGIHPYYADKATSENLKKLADLSQHPQFVAVGEIGLDYAKSPIPKETQIDAFKKLLELTLQLNKPLVIHCRQAFHDLIPTVQSLIPSRQPQSPGVIHCFTGSHSDAECLTAMGFYLGVDAPITYPSAKDLRETFKKIPMTRLVLETDSPYLPPQPFRGKRNEPKYIPLIGQELAFLTTIPLVNVKQTCLQNSYDLFRLPAL